MARCGGREENEQEVEKDPLHRSEVFDTTFFDTDMILILSRSEKSIRYDTDTIQV